MNLNDFADPDLSSSDILFFRLSKTATVIHWMDNHAYTMRPLRMNCHWLSDQIHA